MGTSFCLEAEAVRSVRNHTLTECKSLWYPVGILQGGKWFKEYADLIDSGILRFNPILGLCIPRGCKKLYQLSTKAVSGALVIAKTFTWHDATLINKKRHWEEALQKIKLRMQTGSVARGKMQNYTRCLKIPPISEKHLCLNLAQRRSGFSHVSSPLVNTGRWQLCRECKHLEKCLPCTAVGLLLC